MCSSSSGTIAWGVHSISQATSPTPKCAQVRVALSPESPQYSIFMDSKKSGPHHHHRFSTSPQHPSSVHIPSIHVMVTSTSYFLIKKRRLDLHLAPQKARKRYFSWNRRRCGSTITSCTTTGPRCFSTGSDTGSIYTLQKQGHAASVYSHFSHRDIGSICPSPLPKQYWPDVPHTPP